jgi:hypothetical protein
VGSRTRKEEEEEEENNKKKQHSPQHTIPCTQVTRAREAEAQVA